MIVRKCEACGLSNADFLLQDQVHHYFEDESEATWTYNLAKCNNCGLVYIDPKPSWDLLQTFYELNYGCYDSSIALPENEAFSLKYRLASWRYPNNTSIGLMKTIKKLIAISSEWASGKTISYSLAMPLGLDKNAQIFELGYGSGNWLQAMAQLGYQNLHGYDIDANSENVKSLKSAGIHVTNGIFLENEYPDEFFDCIRLEHVFEHLIEPQHVLEKCWRMLKPGGILVMNFPIGDSISFSVSIVHSSLRQSPSHIFLHTKTSALMFLEKTSFTDIKISQYPVSLQFGGTLNNLLREKNIRIPWQLFVVGAPVYHLLGQLAKRGDFMTLLASKP